MEPFIISGPEGLLKLTSKDKAAISGEIILKIPQLDFRENARYEKLLNNWYNACGCELGAIFSLISIGGYMLYFFTSLKTFSWIHLRNGIIIFFLAALLGKCLGIIFAKYRLKRTVKKLVSKLNQCSSQTRRNSILQV